MPSIELLLDRDAEGALRGEWQALADVGLPSQARHTAPSNRPHITLLYSNDSLDPPRVVGLPLPVTVASPVIFGSARRGFLLARSVRPSLPLLELHRTLHEEVGDRPGIDRLTRPGAWTAHVTIARHLTPEQLAAALTVVEPKRAIEATAVAARLWESATKTITELALA
jgi:2'-5' RNA ligase superfamily